jgi:hypothetical protein
MRLGLGLSLSLSKCPGVYMSGLCVLCLLSLLLSMELGTQRVGLHLQREILAVQLVMELLIEAKPTAWNSVFLARHRRKGTVGKERRAVSTVRRTAGRPPLRIVVVLLAKAATGASQAYAAATIWHLQNGLNSRSRFLKNGLLLDSRKFVLLTGLVQLSMVSEKLKCSPDLQVDATPGKVVSRIPKVPFGVEGLFDA